MAAHQPAHHRAPDGGGGVECALAADFLDLVAVVGRLLALELVLVTHAAVGPDALLVGQVAGHGSWVQGNDALRRRLRVDEQVHGVGPLLVVEQSLGLEHLELADAALLVLQQRVFQHA
jgi:hypothetical protein